MSPLCIQGPARARGRRAGVSGPASRVAGAARALPSPVAPQPPLSPPLAVAAGAAV
jgi:hypothetical protein